MQLDFAPRFDRMIDRHRRAKAEDMGFCARPDGSVLCQTHADSPTPHTYILRPQPDGGMSCTCPDYHRAPSREDGTQDPCKHIYGYWRWRPAR